MDSYKSSCYSPVAFLFLYHRHNASAETKIRMSSMMITNTITISFLLFLTGGVSETETKHNPCDHFRNFRQFIIGLAISTSIHEF